MFHARDDPTLTRPHAPPPQEPARPAAPGYPRTSTGTPCHPQATPRCQRPTWARLEGRAGRRATKCRRRESRTPTPTRFPPTRGRRAPPWPLPGRGMRRRCIPSRCRPGRGLGWAHPHHPRTHREPPSPNVVRPRATASSTTTRTTLPRQHRQQARAARAYPRRTRPASP